MNTDEILQTLSSALLSAGEFLKDLGIRIWNGIQEAASNAALAVSAHLSDVTLPMMPTILKIFSNKKANEAVFFIVLLYIIVINICAFTMFGSDKKKAQTRRARRTSEKALLRVCLMGGAAGGLVGMQIFRHKTLHKKFTILVPVMFAIELVLMSFILGFLGFWAFF